MCVPRKERKVEIVIFEKESLEYYVEAKNREKQKKKKREKRRRKIEKRS